MKILHTSDWHLGGKLYERPRTDEHEYFLRWLRQLVITEKINAIIVSGDVFDNKNPQVESQELYVRFLKELLEDRLSGKSVCRHLVIIAGNHDSADFLAMNHSLFRYLDIHIIGNKPDDWETAVLELKDGEKTQAIVAAFPFLSEVEIRKPITIPMPDPTSDETDRKVEAKKIHKQAALQAYKDNWQAPADLCVARREQCQSTDYIPLISTGHLFAEGGKTISGDGVRDLYVGTLEHFPGGDIPKQFDYVALGHLHVPQQVGQNEHHRYSGSPLPIDFNEATQQKQVVLVEWDRQGNRTITPINIPTIRKLVKIKGDWATIQTEIATLLQSLDESSDKPHELDNEPVWLAVEYTETDKQGSLTLISKVEYLLEGHRSVVVPVRCSSPNVVRECFIDRYDDESLNDLEPMTVFEWVLDEYKIVVEAERNEFIQTYREAIALCKF